MAPITLDGPEFDPLDLLIRRESGLTGQAFAPATYFGSIFRKAGIDDFIIYGAAFGATHCGLEGFQVDIGTTSCDVKDFLMHGFLNHPKCMIDLWTKPQYLIHKCSHHQGL
jgi:hypothetical protein